MLHTIRCSPFSNGRWESLLSSIRPGDAVVLFQDGVVAGLSRTLPAQQLLDTGATIRAVAADVAARGLLQKIEKCIKLIDYSGFVALTVAHSPQRAW